MALLFKDVEELKGLGELYEFDLTKKYLFVINRPMSSAHIEVVRNALHTYGLDNVALLITMKHDFRIFELEHRV